jgi:hypothetical protein
MALPRGELSTLLRDLRAAGPVDRVRLLARSLSSLRRLSPWDRKILLRMAGFEGAESLVERLAQDDEATAGRLRRLLAELEEEPEALERTVRDLGDPKSRSRAVDELLATLDRGMAAEEEPAAAPEAPSPELRPGPVPEPPPVPPPGDGPAPLPEAPPVPERPVPLAAPPPRPTAPGRPAPPPPIEAPADAAEPAGASPDDTDARSPKESPRPAAPPPSPTPTLAAPPEPADGAPASAAQVLDRLLALRRGTAGPPPDARELGRTLEREIPFPWARRRALQAWIEVGGAADLDGALDLIGELPAAADRTWCLATLMAHGAWSDADRERIAGAAPTPAARRRLERRRAG